MVRLKNLFIGYADGETESQESLFKDMFYKNNQKYDEITNNWAKFIISGPKGSGKTILGRYIKKMCDEQNIKCKILKSDAIILNKLISLGKDSLESSEIIIFYRWFILLELSKLLFEKKLTHKDIEPHCLKRLTPKSKNAFKQYSETYDDLLNLYNERFNEGNYESSSINILDQLNTLLSSSLEVNVPKTVKLNTKADLQETFKEEQSLVLKPYFKMINEFESKLFICMKYHKLVLILDDIDEMKVKLDTNEESRIFLEYLIIMLKDLNSKFKEYDLCPSKCILLLRSDILNTLNKHSSNLNKILADRSVELYWLDKDNKYPENHILIDMIFHKIRLSCEEYKDLSNIDLYYKLFPENIAGKTATNFLLDYSFGRPRDIIYYLSVIQTRFKNHKYFAPTSFIQCENEYSNSFKNELLNELSLHLDVHYVEDLFKLISDFKRLSFYYNDIKKFYDQNKLNYPHIVDLKVSISDLYSFGVLGNSYKIKDPSDEDKNDKNNKNNKNKNSYGYSWAYRRDGSNDVNFNQQLSVHYGLRSSLGLKKIKNRNKNKSQQKKER